ncbi:MAG: histidinol-phosphate transaminase [Clostridia bacterium]|nr:histidinol-phosphate transaminase [Clostridia bacterium]MBQ8850772.1 histidinol-phosphate transaminase [Clostridia bacterium]
MSRFINKKYASLEAYTPGEQPRERKYIKLNTNESPYPPSDGVIKAVNEAEVSLLNLYPDPTCKALKEKLAALYGVKGENIFVSNGSDDILNFSFMAFCNDSDRLVKFPEISYGFYKVYAELYGVKYSAIPLREDFTVDITDYFGNNANVVIANPNAPTGIALTVEEIEQILKANPDFVVLIDEAYVDFGAESCLPLVDKYDNLLVVRTYSKSRSMAGARLGFAIGSAELIADLEKIKFSTNPYNINRLTLVAGEAAVDDDGYYVENCKKVADTREYTTKKLKELGFECTPSKSNFIFAKSNKIGGEELYLKLKERGILVRHFSNGKICEYNRITVGTPEQMDALIAEIASITEETK